MKELGNEKKASMHACMHWGRNVCHILYLLYTSELDTKVRELAIKTWTTVRMKSTKCGPSRSCTLMVF